MRRLLPKLLFLLILFLSGSIVLAQPSKKAIERIRLIKKLKLIEVLELDEETSEKVIKVYEQWEDKIEKQQQIIHEAAQDLEISLKRGDALNVIKKKSDRFMGLQKQLQDLIYDKFTAMRKILDDRQFAKFLVFEHYFKIELLKIMKKHRSKRHKE